MQRMSNMLTRLLEGRLRQGSNEAQSSNEAAADQESDERGEQDLSGETGAIDSSGSSVLTAESSLSSSDASSAAFVSCSASDREVSNEDSKDAYEMSECTPADRRSAETTEERQAFKMRTGHALDRDVVADERQFISENRAASETAMLEMMPSLPDHSNFAASRSNEFATPIDLCAKGRDDGVIGAVASKTVAERLDGVSLNQKCLSRERLVAEPVNELLSVVNVTCGQSYSDPTEMKVDETPICLGTIPVSSRPAVELVSTGGLWSDSLPERISAAEGAGAEQKILRTSDVLLDQQTAESSDMSCDGATSLESSASLTSPQVLSMQETVAEDSILISIPSSGAEDCVDGSGLDGREDEPREQEEASGSLGIFPKY